MRTIKIAIAALAALLCICSCAKKVEENSEPKYVFLFIGDGMSSSAVSAAESYLNYKAGVIGGEQLGFTKFPVYGTCTTHSSNHPVTCSSAAGTAIATGTKTKNYKLGTDPDGEPLKSIAYDFKEMGYKIGIMTTVPINHATPAAFYASVQNRGEYREIIKQLPRSGFNFFAGSGILGMDANDGSHFAADSMVRAEGYEICFGVDELKACEDRDGVLVLAKSQKEKVLNYEVVYGENDDTGAEILEAGIEFLGTEQPFFIMYEGGEIDWTAHGNDLMGTVTGILKFDDAIQVAYDFYLKHPNETLIVVTADHETGGVALGTDGYDFDWEKIENAKVKTTYDWENNRAISKSGNIGWTSTNHTGGPVPVFAIGKGAEKFMGRMDNTEISVKLVPSRLDK